MKESRKIYFASDAHLGYPNHNESLVREKRLVKWLETVRHDASAIYLLGDVFDYWYEYKKVVPRGFTRLLGKISEITDSGIPIYFFTGNHDISIYDYLPLETGVTVQHKPLRKTLNGLRFFMAHGDGLDPADKTYRRIRRIYVNPAFQWFFSKLHPNFTIWFAHKWSYSSRSSKNLPEFKGEENESMIRYSRELLTKEEIDFFIFGHRHIPLDFTLNEKSRLIYLGDWLTHFSYAVLDGKNMELKKFED
jgi:UDP-2,3-diacylglucosamine hydrolase